MAIHVKYFGTSETPAFEQDFGSMEELMETPPFKPFGKDNKLGPDGRGYIFTDTPWEKAKISGKPLHVPAFDDVANRILIPLSDLLGGSEDAITNIVNNVLNEVKNEIKQEIKNEVMQEIHDILPAQWVTDVAYFTDTRQFRKYFFDKADAFARSFMDEEVVFTAVEECGGVE